MTPVFAARRRAEEFDSLVEGSSTGVTDTRYAEFLEVVGALRSVPGPQARPEFVASLRERLMAAAESELVPNPESRLTLPARKPVRDRRIAAAVGGFAIVGATTSMAMAAQSALPGDALYPLKRAIENAEAGISVNDGQKGATLLANASGRLDEVTELSTEGGLDDGTAIAETLNAFTEQATQASDLLLSDYATTGHESSISELRDFTALSMETLAELEAIVPDEARDELLHAARVLTQIDAEAAQACPTCAGAGITEIPRILTTPVGFSGAGVEATPANDSEPTGDKEQESTEPEVPDTDPNALPPGSVLTPPDSDTPGGTGGGGDEEPADDPITSLTDGLVGGDSQPTSNPSGLPGLPAVEEDVTDAVDEVTDPLTGANDKAKQD